MNKKWVYGLALAAALRLSPAEAHVPPQVPEDIYQWVQASERISYFFNKQQICYGVDAQGRVDLDTLIVPVLKIYDNVQIEDVLMKRSWRIEPTEGFEDLSGEANYLTIHIPRGVVTVDAVDLIDSHFWTLAHSEPKREVVIADLTDKSRDGIFYRAILEYEEGHRAEILSHTEGTLAPEDMKRLEKEEKRHAKDTKERKQKRKKKREAARSEE